MATRIILFSAGETDWDAERRIQGDLEVPLNEKGRAEVLAQAEELRALKPKLIYTAATQSAKQTADALGKALKVKVRQQRGLNAVNFGLWQGLLLDEVDNRHPKVFKRWMAEPASVEPPEGEPFAKARARVAKAIETILKRHDGETIVLVCPRAVKTFAQSLLSRKPVAWMWDDSEPNAGWTEFEVDGL